jgi:hypothetical protein
MGAWRSLNLVEFVFGLVGASPMPLAVSGVDERPRTTTRASARELSVGSCACFRWRQTPRVGAAEIHETEEQRVDGTSAQPLLGADGFVTPVASLVLPPRQSAGGARPIRMALTPS